MSDSNNFINAQSFSEALNTGVKFPSFDTLRETREKSVKQESTKTYDRYEKYHLEYKQFTLVDKVIVYVFDKIEKLILKRRHN